MKNHKGMVATLLTLGLVIVGTLVTLGTSLFVSNRNSNLASNSRAASMNCMTPRRCNDKVFYQTGGTYYSSNKNGRECVGKIDNINVYCKTGLGADSGSAPATLVAGSTAPASSGAANPALANCKGAPNAQACRNINGSYIYNQSKKLCCPSNNPPIQDVSTAPAITAAPATAPVADNSDGVPRPNMDCCFTKNEKTTVYATAASRVANQMTAPCTTEAYKGAYGATWDYCKGGSNVSTTNACENSGFTCKSMVGKTDVYNACSPMAYVPGVSCGDTTKACCKNTNLVTGEVPTKTPTPAETTTTSAIENAPYYCERFYIYALCKDSWYQAKYNGKTYCCPSPDYNFIVPQDSGCGLYESKSLSCDGRDLMSCPNIDGNRKFYCLK